VIGSTFGPYEILAKLGAGGMGEVYRARDTALGREVAIKILSAAVVSHPEGQGRFEREARALAALNHPHIATLYGVERRGDTRALIMELIEGDTLAERLSRARLSVGDALAIARQIADAIEAAHAKGIVHRDLKPANIKVTASGVVKVLDFGLAKAVDGAPFEHQLPTMAEATREGIIVGTAAYMSPQQARGQTVDRDTDIWAFGCVLFEMLARPTFPTPFDAGAASA
jgi:eukaryotic-like serine/threonine-protein kinase